MKAAPTDKLSSPRSSATPHAADGYAGGRCDAHAECTASVAADPAALFAWLDDPRHLGSHMQRRSWRTLGTKMEYRFDALEGRALGSSIRLVGDLWGIPLSVDEVVVEHEPPRRKSWQTVGDPCLVVIGPYRMGFEISPAALGSLLAVGIDYQWPRWRPALLARWAARRYADWCVRRMAGDAAAHFANEDPHEDEPR